MSSHPYPTPPHPRESWGFKEGEQQWFVLGVLSDSPAHGHFIILLLNQGQQVLLLCRLGDRYALCHPTPTPPHPTPERAEVLKKESSNWFVLGVLSDSPAHGHFIILLLNQGQQVLLLCRLGDRYALCHPTPTPPHPTPERAEVLKKESSNWFVLGVLSDSPAHGHFIILLLLLNQGQQVLVLHRLVDRYAVCPPTPTLPHPTPERAEVLKKDSSNWFVQGVLSDSPAHGHFIILLLLLNQGQQVLLLHRLVDRYALCHHPTPPLPTPPSPKSWGFKEGEQQWFVLGVLSDSPAHGLFIILTLLNQGQQVPLLHRLADRYALCGTLGVESGWDVSSPHPTPPLPPERAEVLKKESSNWFVLGVLSDSPAHGHSSYFSYWDLLQSWKWMKWVGFLKKGTRTVNQTPVSALKKIKCL